MAGPPSALRSPTPLAAGDAVAALAPSSPFDPQRYRLGADLIGSRYRLVESPSLFARAGFLAGDDGARARDVTGALGDPAIRAVVPARGGYGATRLLPLLEPARVADADTWLVGFSDVTALHALWFRAGLTSIHGPMVCSLESASPPVRDVWFALLEGAKPASLTGLSRVVSGAASGRLFGGNLTVLTSLAGTPYLPDLTDTVLLLEDVTERPYRIDRMLTTLLQSGALSGVRGVVLGQFTQCEPGPDGHTTAQVLVERLSTLGVPMVKDAPVGHVDDNCPLLLGAEVVLDADAGSLRFA